MPRGSWLRAWWCLLACWLLAGPLPAQPAPTALDSLHLPGRARWPLAVQVRLASARLTARTAPVAEALTRQGHLPAPVRARLLLQVGRYNFYAIQPSLALMRLLECQQLAVALPDSVLRSTVAAEICYAYYLLKQPRTGLAWGDIAARWVAGPDRRHMQARAYGMSALCARDLGDPAAELRYLQQAARIYQHEQNWFSIANIHFELGETAVRARDYATAARHLDTMRQAAPRDQRPHPNLQNQSYLQTCIQQLAAEVALGRGRYPAAVALLRPLVQQARQAHDNLLEIQLTKPLVQALTHLGQYQAALVSQQRVADLEHVMYEEGNSRRALEFQAVYQQQAQAQALARQRLRLAGLQTEAQRREAAYNRRLLLLGGALLAAGLLLVLVLVQQRARRLLATATATLRMRTRLAADLHDEVGTVLTRISLQAELLQARQPPDTQPAVARLVENSRAAARTMRDIVWGLDPAADTAGGLLDRMRDYLGQTAQLAGLQTELHADHLPDTTPLPQALRQHLYLVFKEALNNVLRHARHATYVRVTLRQRAGQLELLVQDDGQPSTPPGHGLGTRSMQQRAEALAGHLTLGPRPEGGWQVRLTAPVR